MKTSEFIKIVEELGYNCFTNESCILINKGYPWIATIALHRMYYMELWTNDNKLGELCMEYARTPIEEREEEEKFYLQKMKSFYDNYYNETTNFLNVRKDQDRYDLGTTEQTFMIRTQFTQKEIDKIKEEQHTDLSEFKQIPVEEVGE
jgi:hypothetical protein|nr:MAG TPA: hypothetical protein [Caudoviricetes sp.]